jgi:hypothetical protein
MAGLISSVVGFVLSLFTSVFNWIVARCYTSQIVFNCAWEDPRLDREALKLTEEDQVVIITTAGCNVLSLAIEGPKHVYSIDRNHCQNALLELKLAAIREYDYATFWKLFGTGTYTIHLHLSLLRLVSASTSASKMIESFSSSCSRRRERVVLASSISLLRQQRHFTRPQAICAQISRQI